MNQRVVLLLLFLHSLIFATPQYLFPSEQSETEILNWDVFYYDSLQIAQTGWNRSPQKQIKKTEFLKTESNISTIHWYRTELFFPEPLGTTDGLTISIPALLTSYEIYWDNQLIGINGTISTQSHSRPGKSGRYFYLSPTQSSTGSHTLSIRVANYGNFSGSLTNPITLGQSEKIRQTHLSRFGTSIFLAGIFVVTALFHLFIIDSRKRRHSHLIFSLFSLSCGGHLAVNILIHFGAVPQTYLQFLAIAGDLFWLGMIALLPIFLLSHFSAYARNISTTIILILTITVVLLPRLALYNILPIRYLPVLHDLNLFYAYLSVITAISVTLGASVRKRKGSRTILIGMIIFLAGLIITTAFQIENGWSVGFAFLNVFITITIARQFSEERKQYYKAELRASRLELELLKGHMQPHFLLNSLNSIVAWIEEEPAVAARLVNALSQELRMLMAFAGERKINLSQEIKMCRIHLEVMNMRQEKNYVLHVQGEREGIDIPPFILHTLIENGISHGFRKKDDGIFTLTVHRNSETITMTLHNNGDNKVRTATGEGKGTGTRYIRSRLQELYGINYSFSSHSTADGWESRITIPEGVVL